MYTEGFLLQHHLEAETADQGFGHIMTPWYAGGQGVIPCEGDRKGLGRQLQTLPMNRRQEQGMKDGPSTLLGLQVPPTYEHTPLIGTEEVDTIGEVQGH